jgi:hypothetical protein
MPSRLARLLVCLLVCLPATRALAQDRAVADEPAVLEKIGKEIHAFRIVGAAPRIDGRIDDAVWQRAQAIDDMVQNEPENMAPPGERMVVQIAYDDQALYVAVQCLVRDRASITPGLGRRDNLPPSDLIRLSIDARHDHQNAYVFETNPSGMQSDYLFYDDTRQSTDYDAVWDVRTTMTDSGWFAEYAIPFSQMRFTVPAGDRVVWGFNIRRDIQKTGEYDRWVPTPRGAAGFVSRFGHLIFDEHLNTPRRLELLPSMLARREDGSATSAVHSVAGGLDMRVGLGPATTFSATINPDFAQVEQDPSVLNLSVFETFFPEKRPFFLEDSRLFVPPYGQMIMFHSRRIGRAPGRVSLPDGDSETGRPESTTILGAAKVTGRAGGWTYGGISALTDAEYAMVDNTEGGAGLVSLERLVEPRTSYNVGRVQRDLNAGTSNIGGIVTGVMRDGDKDAFTASSDYTFRWDSNRGSLNGQWAATHAPFSSGTKSGWGGVTNFNYERKHVGVNGHLDHFSPTFRIADIGFLASRLDKTEVNYGLNVMQPDPRGPFKSVRAFQYGSMAWNASQIVFSQQLGTGINADFGNYWSVYGEVWRDFDRYDDLDSRGGPVIVAPGKWGFSTGFSSDSRKSWQARLDINREKDDAGGSELSIGPYLRVKPRPQLQASIEARYQPALTIAQWIKNTDATGDGVTDYVYGTLKRRVVNVTARATYAFTRDMTLEAYMQPFVAVGHYTDIRRLVQDKSFVFDSVTLPDNVDFNDKSIRSNVVFRWEYQKGSAFFVVWNRSTLDPARPGVFGGLRDLGDAFSGPGTDIFMVKLSYWLGL